jgi:transposase
MQKDDLTRLAWIASGLSKISGPSMRCCDLWHRASVDQQRASTRKARPVCLLISPGEAHDASCADALLNGPENGAVVIADKAYDADNIRADIRHQGAVPNIPNRSNRKTKYRWTKALYRERNRVERFFNRLKQFRRIATRYDKLGANFFAFVKFASMRIWLRSIESTP